jgi:hypothetical protein
MKLASQRFRLPERQQSCWGEGAVGVQLECRPAQHRPGRFVFAGTRALCTSTAPAAQNDYLAVHQVCCPHACGETL